jgi:MFS family permease
MDRVARSRSLWRHADFLKLWAGQSISELGSEITLLALPLVAVLTLHAGALEVGLLGTAGFAPFILVGLPAGVWVDRFARRRPILIIADAGRVFAIGSIPVAAAVAHITLVQLYVVAFITGVLTVFFDVAYQSYLPALVERDQLVDGNAKLELTRSGAALIGPPIGGSLVGVFGAPIAMTADAVSYVASVASLLTIREREPRVERPAVRTSMRSDIAAGLRYVLGHPLLRPIAMCTSTWNLFGNIYFAILVLFCVRQLGMSPTSIGLAVGVGSIGAPIGALLARRISDRIGVGSTIVFSAALGASGLLVAFAQRSTAVPLLIAASFLGAVGVIYNITQVSLRQAICQPAFQGRMNASMRFVVWGTIPIANFLGGLLGSTIGLRPTMVIGSAGTLLAVIPVALSPVRRLRTIEEAIPADMRASAATERPAVADMPLPGAIAPVELPGATEAQAGEREPSAGPSPVG